MSRAGGDAAVAVAALLSAAAPLLAQSEVAKTTAALQRLKTGVPNSWFEYTRLFLGSFRNTRVCRGQFPFKNPGDEAVTWRDLRGSCQCARAVVRVGDRIFELGKRPTANSLHELTEENGKTVRTPVGSITIGPRQAGVVEVEMEIDGVKGYKTATFSAFTTDPETKHVSLAWQAQSIQMFNVIPAEFVVEGLTPQSRREFSFVVDSLIRPDFQLLGHERLPPYIKLRKRRIRRPDGSPAWRVDGVVGPGAQLGIDSTAIVFKTDVLHEDVRFLLLAPVAGPLKISPDKFLALGKIDRAKGRSREISILPTGDGKIDPASVTVSFAELSVAERFLTSSVREHDSGVVVDLRVLPGCEGAMLRGLLVIRLVAPPSQETKVPVRFSGFVR